MINSKEIAQKSIEMLRGIVPGEVFKYFAMISSIPRMPGKQKDISDFIVEFSKECGLECYQDEQLNVVVYKPSISKSNSPSVAIQAHLDMVCEKEEGSYHDFETDPLILNVEDGKLSAKGTTLGADNGIGVAYMMALMNDKSIIHPDLELIFTTDEESDMSGASKLDYSNITSKLIVNLDSPPIGVCGAGEVELRIFSDYYEQVDTNLSDKKIITITLNGLQGGHSGQNAMEERGNAINLLNRILIDLQQKLEFNVISFLGGLQMASAIPRSASCTLVIDTKKLDSFRNNMEVICNSIISELASRDSQIQISWDITEKSEIKLIPKNVLKKINQVISLLPEGVALRNKEFVGAMESCSNIGVAKITDGKVEISILIRSTTDSYKKYLLNKATLLCELLEFDYKIDHDVPSWRYSVDTETLNTLKKIYSQEKLLVSEGTLECGYFTENIKDSCVISLGCPYYNAHSPSEFVWLEEVGKYWELLLEFLRSV